MINQLLEDHKLTATKYREWKNTNSILIQDIYQPPDTMSTTEGDNTESEMTPQSSFVGWIVFIGNTIWGQLTFHRWSLQSFSLNCHIFRFCFHRYWYFLYWNRAALCCLLTNKQNKHMLRVPRKGGHHRVFSPSDHVFISFTATLSFSFQHLQSLNVLSIKQWKSWGTVLLEYYYQV